jgi:hypothetical protein
LLNSPLTFDIIIWRTLNCAEGDGGGGAQRDTGKIYGANGAAALLGLKPTTLASKLPLGLKREEFLHG